tara:strand:- start:360 stop:533 length:174 start_codon:yes stop_codon:yes gene_type:complete
MIYIGDDWMLIGKGVTGINPEPVKIRSESKLVTYQKKIFGGKLCENFRSMAVWLNLL